MKRCKTFWSSCCWKLLPFKFCNIHWKTYALVSLFNKFVGLDACNIIKKSDSDTGVRLRLMWILQTFLGNFFSIENLRWLNKFTNLLTEKSSTYISLGLWSKGPDCNPTEQLFFCTVADGCFRSFIWYQRDQKKKKITYQILEEKLKQLAFLNCCLVLSKSCSMLYLASSRSRTHYSIALKCWVAELQ